MVLRELDALVRRFQQGGQGKTIHSWIGQGENPTHCTPRPGPGAGTGRPQNAGATNRSVATRVAHPIFSAAARHHRQTDTTRAPAENKRPELGARNQRRLSPATTKLDHRRRLVGASREPCLEARPRRASPPPRCSPHSAGSKAAHRHPPHLAPLAPFRGRSPGARQDRNLRAEKIGNAFCETRAGGKPACRSGNCSAPRAVDGPTTTH